MNPFALLSGYARIAVGIALTLVLAGAAWKVHHWHSEHYVAKADYDAVRRDLTQAQANEATVKDSLTVQNAAIERLKAESDAQARAAAKARSEADLIRRKGIAMQKEIDSIKLTGNCDQDMRSLGESVK